jgi:diguanylate cyclase (GGDEF)-like protein/PAS domain S-box-containing protein
MSAMQLQAALLDAVGQAVIATDMSGVIVYWNMAAEATYGWSAAEALGQLARDVVAPQQAPEQTAAICSALQRGESWSGDLWVARRDESRFHAQVLYTPVGGPDGSPAAIIGVTTDVTDHLTEMEACQRLAAIVDSSDDAIFSLTVDGLISSWNGSAERLLGYTAEEIMGRSVLVLADEGRHDTHDAVQRVLAAGGQPVYLETVRRRKDGTAVNLAITVSGIEQAGSVIGLSVIAHDITLRQSALRRVERISRRLAEAQAIAQVGSFEFNIVTGAMAWSEEHYRIVGLEPGSPLTAQSFLLFVHRDDVERLTDAWQNAMGQGTPFDLRYRIIRPDGEERFVHGRVNPERAEDDTLVSLFGTLLDDTERVSAERVRKAAEARYQMGFQQAAVGIAVTDLEGRVVEVNPALCSILDRHAEEIIGRSLHAVWPAEDPGFGPALGARMAAGESHYEDERRCRRSDGSLVWVSMHVNLVRDEYDMPDYYFVQLEDIDERKELSEELAHQAFHDSLTGLPNGAALDGRLSVALHDTRASGTELAVMVVDIDHLKTINDTFGHAGGDEVLQHISDCIAETLRPGDTVARLGADEFVLVCEDIDATAGTALAERVLSTVRVPYHLDGHETSLSVSIGIAIADDVATPRTLTQDADAAMYRAKLRGRGQVALYDDVLRTAAQRRMSTERELRRALELGEFTVHYQPIVDLVTEAVVGAEALVRWEHPERGLLGPDAFISLAEETGLIVPIGSWVLEQACRELVGWQREEPSMTLAVNLSVHQVAAPGVVNMVNNVLARTGVRGTDLCLELTESVLMDDVDHFGTILARLKALGVRLSIDDFGTGYSSLSYLKRFPLDEVKIDRGFVDGLGTDAHDSALVAAILAMASALGLGVTAEGVENGEQLELLKKMRCAERRASSSPGPCRPVTWPGWSPSGGDFCHMTVTTDRRRSFPYSYRPVPPK